jgi:hypothetical protein
VTWHPDMPPEFRDSVVTGDARELAARIPDGSVDLVFCDPVYDRSGDYEWLATETRRLLQPGGRALCFCGIGMIEATLAAVRRGGMPAEWVGGIYKPGGCQRVWPQVFNHWCALLWLAGRPVKTTPDILMSNLSECDGGHAWKKFSPAIARYVEAFSRPGETVWDPFTGGGTVPAVCKQLGRRFVAFEICPATAEKARRRVRDTPMPLPFEEPARQVELPLGEAA